MNSQLFMDKFPVPPDPSSDIDLEAEANCSLDTMLRELGHDDHRSPNSELSLFADDFMQSYLEDEKQNVLCTRVVGFNIFRDRIVQASPRDRTAELSQEELEASVSAHISAQRASLCLATTFTLANAIALSSKVKPNEVPTQAIGSSHRAVSWALESPATIRVDVTRSFYKGSRVGKTEVDFRAPVTHTLPAWMRGAQHWEDGPSDTITGFHIELDAFVVLREWCRQRRNGYFPVFAPTHIDSGQYAESRKQSNFQSDILLVKLDSESPEILPVQVKNIIRDTDREKYDPKVMLMMAQDLDLVTLHTGPIEVNGMTRTGSMTTVHAGQHAMEWSTAAKSKKNARQKASSFVKKLKTTFNRVDQLVEATPTA